MVQEGNIDMSFGTDYTGLESSSVNVEDTLSSLFKEIGTTLKDVTKQGISSVGDTVKTALANRIMESPEGQAEIAKYKLQYLLKYLPWIGLGAILLILAGKFFFRK